MTTTSRTKMTIPVREAPTSSPSPRGVVDPAHPDVSKGKVPEPQLAVDQIQGNILPGFLKDFETLLFLKIDHVADCKHWLKQLVPLIATAEEVLTFNRLFKAIRHRRGQESNAVKATWVNIAFSYHALKELTKGTPADVATQDFTDASFKKGLAAQSPSLGDPTNRHAEGHPHNWVVGGPHNEADIVLIVQSDDRDDLFEQVEQIEDRLYAFRRPDGTPASSGVHLIFKQHGANLPGSLAGHEHFGFLDGVSQPGIRGYVSEDGTNVLTPRQNPRDENQGKPGQDLLWPGEFVFKYQGQDPNKPVEEPGNPVHAGPTWAENGSFLVLRRLRQDVAGFHTFLHEQGQHLKRDPKLVGAKIVGRWPSGAPILRSAQADNAELGNDECANNDFEFFKQDPSLVKPHPGAPPPDIVPQAGTDDQCQEPAQPQFEASPGDQVGKICPAFGHIRKAYPRDDLTPAAPTDSDKSEQSTQTHRLLRRGIPYGPVSLSTPDAPFSDSVDRGLLFVAYMTSIENQFEFATKAWVNNPNFHVDGVGFDLVIGQNSHGNRVRTAQLILDDPHNPVTLTAPRDWVIPTGGGYFFAPSISALENELS